jgi:hypothetical protein
MKRQWNDKMAKACMRYEYQLQIIAVDFIAAVLSIHIYIIQFSEVVNTFTLRSKCVCLCCIVYWLSVDRYKKIETKC